MKQETIEYKVTLDFPVKGRMSKIYRLITPNEAKCLALGLGKYNTIKDIFERIESNNYLGDYYYPTPDGKQPRVMDIDFLDRINWVTRRAVASLGMPCTLCGEVENVEMHHIPHIRKTSYNNLDKKKPWLKNLSHKNRKQIPVCFHCHRWVIHPGKYIGPKLTGLSPVYVETDTGLYVKLFDGRQINLENYIKPGREYGSKPLEKRGWFEDSQAQLLSKKNKIYK